MFIEGGTLLLGCVALGCLAVGCRSSDTHGRDADLQPRALSFERLEVGTQSAVRDKAVRVAWTEGELEALWSEHKKLQLPVPRAPKIEMTGCAVVGVFLGNRPSGGWTVEVGDVGLSAQGAIVVHALEHAPAAGAITTQAITSPYAIVVVEGAPPSAPVELILDSAVQ